MWDGNINRALQRLSDNLKRKICFSVRSGHFVTEPGDESKTDDSDGEFHKKRTSRVVDEIRSRAKTFVWTNWFVTLNDRP